MDQVSYTLLPDHRYHSPPHLHMDPRGGIKKIYGDLSAENFTFISRVQKGSKNA